MPFVPIFPNSCNPTITPGTLVFRSWERDPGEKCQDPTISPRDLDWRRKAEILKHDRHHNNTKMTQKERYKRAATNSLVHRSHTYAVQNLNRNPKVTNPNISGLPQNGNTLVLPNCGTPITYTTGADVPGPRIALTPVPNVPLTRYPQQRRSYLGGSEKWPQWGWYPGANGFPVGKKGNLQ